MKDNNHYVPKVYLKNWATNKEIFQYRLLVSNENVYLWNKQSIKNTAYIKDLYIRIIDSGFLDDFEIDFDRRYESPVEPCLKKVLIGKCINKQEWKTIINFILAQYVRTPSFYIFTKDQLLRDYPEIIEYVANKTASLKKVPQIKPNYNDEYNELLPLELTKTNIKPDENHTLVKVDFIIGKNTWLFAIKHFLDKNSELRKVYNKMKWCIINSHKSVCWPTSDNPVVIVKNLFSDNYELTNKIGRFNDFILFPVSPNKAILGTNNRAKPYIIEADKKLSITIKELIVKNSLLYVYSSFPDKEIPSIRKRIVDKEEYERIEKQFLEWFILYENTEGPYLRKQSIYKQTK